MDPRNAMKIIGLGSMAAVDRAVGPTPLQRERVTNGC